MIREVYGVVGGGDRSTITITLTITGFNDNHNESDRKRVKNAKLEKFFLQYQRIIVLLQSKNSR